MVNRTPKVTVLLQEGLPFILNLYFRYLTNAEKYPAHEKDIPVAGPMLNGFPFLFSKRRFIDDTPYRR